MHRRLAALLLTVLLAPACVPAHAPMRLTLAGDVHVDQRGGDVLAPLAPLFEGSIGVVNLEGAVSEAAAPAAAPREVRLVNPPSAADALRAIGVRVACIDNNHARDLGVDAPARTAAALAEAGLIPVGGAAGVAVLEEGGQRVAVLAQDLTGGVPSGLEAALGRARVAADALVVLYHVTGPPSFLPTPELVQAVALALAAGAVVVAAHGTHAIGAVERRGDSVVAWGLGNVAFACDCTDESDAIALRVTLDAGRLEEVAVLPIDAGLRGEPARPSADAAGIRDLLRALGTDPALLDAPTP